MRQGITLADVLGAECSAPDCGAPSMEDAPLPICTRHYIAVVRHFNQSVKSSALARDEWEHSAGLGAIPREPTVTTREFVYFIRYRDRLKIGTTTNPARRLASLPLDEVLAIVPGGREIEQEWHSRYEGHRDRGEWFAFTDGMLDTIRSLGICA